MSGLGVGSSATTFPYVFHTFSNERHHSDAHVVTPKAGVRYSWRLLAPEGWARKSSTDESCAKTCATEHVKHRSLCARPFTHKQKQAHTTRLTAHIHKQDYPHVYIQADKLARTHLATFAFVVTTAVVIAAVVTAGGVIVIAAVVTSAVATAAVVIAVVTAAVVTGGY